MKPDATTSARYVVEAAKAKPIGGAVGITCTAQTSLDQPTEQCHDEQGIILRHDEPKDRCILARAVTLGVQTVQPVEYIPPELLGEIFIRCLPSDTYIAPAANQAPLLLCQVCSQWRSVALSTPVLWSSIAIMVTSQFCRPASPLIDHWLHRSRATPLSISIDYFFYFTNNNRYPTTKVMLELLVRHYSRWQNIEFHLRPPEGDNEGPLLPAPSGDATMLESVTVDRWCWREDDMAQLSSMFASAPRLRSISWGCVESDLRVLQAPWSSLTKICVTVYVLSVNDVCDLLSRCPKLVEATFPRVLRSDLFRSPSFASNNTPTLLPHLQTLEIATNQCLSPLFTQLTLPVLTCLKITIDESLYGYTPYEGVKSTWPQLEFVALLVRSGCSLEQMQLHNTAVSSEQIIECLRQSSASLKEFRVWEDQVRKSVTNGVLGVLTVEENAAPTCPKLEFIELLGCIGSERGALADMVESRWVTTHSSVSLKTVRVALSCSYAEDIERLLEMNTTRDGVRVIRYYDGETIGRTRDISFWPEVLKLSP